MYAFGQEVSGFRTRQDQKFTPKAANTARTTARIASPQISPDASGIRRSSSDFGEVLAQISWPTPPAMNVINTEAGINIPIPIAAGDGVFSLTYGESSV